MISQVRRTLKLIFFFFFYEKELGKKNGKDTSVGGDEREHASFWEIQVFTDTADDGCITSLGGPCDLEWGGQGGQ